MQVGDAILALDKTPTLLDYEKLKDQLELKYNEIEKLKLTLATTSL